MTVAPSLPYSSANTRRCVATVFGVLKSNLTALSLSSTTDDGDNLTVVFSALCMAVVGTLTAGDEAIVSEDDMPPGIAHGKFIMNELVHD